MKVYVFDLLAYDRHFEDAKAERFLPYPLPRKHFDPEIAARSYEEHLKVWEEMDRLGFDGVGLNEHHTTPHGLMNSPNMMAAVAAQRTKRLKFLILGNLLPLHNPLRIAEELAMADCLSRGRVISGIARGVPREYKVYRVPMAESRARFEEAFDVIIKAWTQESFTHEGKFWNYKDVAIWPRPYQQPHPPVWIPFTGSRETIEFAGRHNLTGVIHYMHKGLTEDIVGLFARALAQHGHRITPDNLCVVTDAYVADSKAKAVDEYAPYFLYFNQTLWHHGSLPDKDAPPPKAQGFVSSSSLDYVRPENKPFAEMDRAKIRNMTRADVEQRVAANELAWGNPKEVADRLIEVAEIAGANSVMVMLNQGAVPNDMFLEQVRRFGRNVLPRLQAHEVKRIPATALAG
ncbi:MAG: LLM class flavin-dependent oxidoreductase [Bradyrhizobiaceae bacterium]|nr:LLM class flavin-dependent oxidoreductase [Bradyrhizobiaceae bacterium]